MNISNSASDDSFAVEAFYGQLVNMTIEARRLRLYDAEALLTMARSHMLDRKEETGDVLIPSPIPTLWNRVP